MTDEIKRYLDKADHAIIVAEDLMGQGHAPDAASKIYYAMFYATKAHYI
ncbi:MAG: HEPN domain-containing protein [Geobacteraceae bacterium]